MTRSAAPVRQSLLVVAGPGRSGTSAATGLLAQLGYYVPQPEIGANVHNPRGYGESRWAVTFHDKLMAAAGIDMGDTRPDAIELAIRTLRRPQPAAELHAWLSEQFSKSDRVVIKDPRLIWFISLYRTVAADLGVEFGAVSMLRHPAESVHSAAKAYAELSNATRLTGWITGTLAAERSTRDMHRIFVRHADLMLDWHSALAPLDGVLSTPVLSSATAEQLALADRLVEPGLWRSRPEWSDLLVPAPLQDLAMRTYDAIGALLACGPEAEKDVMADIDAVNDDFRAFYSASEAIVHSSISGAQAKERRTVLREIARERAALPRRGAPPAVSRRTIGRGLSLIRAGRGSDLVAAVRRVLSRR